jgi:hypothetical protein
MDPPMEERGKAPRLKKEMAVLPLKWAEMIEVLRRQHIIVFKKVGVPPLP